MGTQKFSQESVNQIVAVRVKREREKMTKEFENKMKRCMAAVHLMLHQEMCALKGEMDDEGEVS